MLLLYALAYPLPQLLKNSSSNSSVAIDDSLEILDHCGDIRSCRTIEQILYSCLAVVFACTWSSVHQNIPMDFGTFPSRWDPRQWMDFLFSGDENIVVKDSFDASKWSNRIHRILFMLLTLLAPELIILWAMRQCYSAWKVQQKYEGKYLSLARAGHFELFLLFPPGYGWTMAHGHFLNMGGFALFEGNTYKFLLKDSDVFSKEEKEVAKKIADDLKIQIDFYEVETVCGRINL